MGIRRDDRDDDTDSRDAGSLSESDLFPSPCGSTFSTAVTDVPSFNPMFEQACGNTSAEFSQREIVSGGLSAITRKCEVTRTPHCSEIADGVTTLRERSHMGSEFSFDQDTAIGGETAHTSDWDSCRSSIPLDSQDSSQNPGNLAVRKAGRPTLPRRDYRWNVWQNTSQTSVPPPIGKGECNGEFSFPPLSVYTKACQQVY